MIKICGIDPSISSTGKCVMELDDNYEIQNVTFYGWSSVKKRALSTDKVKIFHVGTDYSSKSVLERQDLTYELIKEGLDEVSYAAFEGYAFGKSGSNSLIQLGEFNGGLKREIWTMGIGIVAYPPAVVKKFATGNGTADKTMMGAAFRELYGDFYPYEEFNQLPQDESPHADMVDAFWICETLRCHIKYHKLGRDALPEETANLLEAKSGKKAMSIVETAVIRKAK